MAGLKERLKFKTMPPPQGESGEQASTIYLWGAAPYPVMEMPATHFAMADTALRSLDVVPSVSSTTAAPVVKRADYMRGYVAASGRLQYDTVTPQVMDPPDSSKFQKTLIGPHPNYILNASLYRAGFPAALAPGRDPMYLSTKVDQLVTRTTGGPGPAHMRRAPRFTKVQNVPRYSTMPKQYNTTPGK